MRLWLAIRPAGVSGGSPEDTITLAGRDGPVRVHPNVFHAALETAAPNGWQVEQQPTGLVVRLVEPADAAQARDKVRQALVDLAVPCRWWMSSWWPPCTGPGWERSGSSRRCLDPPVGSAGPPASTTCPPPRTARGLANLWLGRDQQRTAGSMVVTSRT